MFGSVVLLHLHLTTQATVASIPIFLGITSYWSETDMRKKNKLVWKKQTGLYQFKTTCTNARYIALFKINWTSSKSYWTWTTTYIRDITLPDIYLPDITLVYVWTTDFDTIDFPRLFFSYQCQSLILSIISYLMSNLMSGKLGIVNENDSDDVFLLSSLNLKNEFFELHTLTTPFQYI